MTSSVDTSKSPLEVMTTFFELFQTGDLAAVCALVAPDGVFHEAESLFWGGNWTGPEGFAALIAKINGPTAMGVEACDIYDCGEFIAMKMQISFTSRASGRQLIAPAVELYTVVDGLIRNVDVYYQDTAAVNDVVNNG
jgi:hypothetical protein